MSAARTHLPDLMEIDRLEDRDSEPDGRIAPSPPCGSTARLLLDHAMLRRRNAGQDRLCSMARHGAGFHPANKIAALGGGAHALQQEVDMKREDMGRTVLPPSRSARNPRIEKISRPRRRFPKSRFSQAGKASEGTPRWIRGLPRLPPSPAMSPMGADSRRHRSARDQAPRRRTRFGAIRPVGDLMAEGDCVDWATPEEVAPPHISQPRKAGPARPRG